MTDVYYGSCQCKRVRFCVKSAPLDVKFCHCRDCQRMHGSPFQWACIFEKETVEWKQGRDVITFYNSELDRRADTWEERCLPCKLSCVICGSVLADEGRKMFLVMGTAFEFMPGCIPKAFLPTCHIFYTSAVVQIRDGLPKWSGHKGKSERMDDK